MRAKLSNECEEEIKEKEREIKTKKKKKLHQSMPTASSIGLGSMLSQ